MIRHLIAERFHQVQLAEIVHRQLDGRYDCCALGRRAYAPPQPPDALVDVDFAEALYQPHIASAPAVHLHAHLQHVGRVGDGARNCAGHCGAGRITPKALVAGLVVEQPAIGGHLLERVVRAELDRTVRGLPQHCRPYAGIKGLHTFLAGNFHERIGHTTVPQLAV